MRRREILINEPGLSTEQHRHARCEKLNDEHRRIAPVAWHIVGKYNAIWLELRTNP
jgi:hypothetical protein